jgi:hypothetical protein
MPLKPAPLLAVGPKSTSELSNSGLSKEAYRVFETEARALLKQAKPDPSAARRRLADAKKEVDKLMAAIRAGIITPTTKAALEEAERALVDARAHLATIEQFEPTQILPRAREIYRDLVARLESIEDVDSAREAIKGIVGETIRLIPENGALTAEIQSAGLAGALQITVVAGAGFERYLAPVLRFPGLR